MNAFPWLTVLTFAPLVGGLLLLGLEAQVQPDVIHLNDFAHGDLPFRAPVLVVGHSCVLSWWEAVKKTELPAEWLRYRNAVRTGIRAAEAVVAPSAAMLRDLERHYGPFARGFRFAEEVDPDRIKAEFSDGLLRLEVPKVRARGSTRIRVERAD